MKLYSVPATICFGILIMYCTEPQTKVVRSFCSDMSRELSRVHARGEKYVNHTDLPTERRDKLAKLERYNRQCKK